MDLEQPCDSCGGTGRQLSDAVRAALEAATETRKSLGCGSMINTRDLNKVILAAVGEFVHVTERAQATEAILPPTVKRRWDRRDHEPGPEVTAVRDCDLDVWIRSESGWIIPGPGHDPRAVDWDAVLHYAPLEDWTHEVD